MTQLTVVQQVCTTIDQMQPKFRESLPAHISPQKFARVAINAIQNSPKLAELDRSSVYTACLKAAQDGLLPDGREGAIIPRKGVAVWQPMVAGIMKKVRASGDISSWSVQAIYANDDFDYELGDNEFIRHKPKLGDRGALIGAYSIVILKDGERSREVMGIEEINGIRDRSDGYKYAKSKGGDNPWISDPSEMAKKTVIKRHAKRLPMSTDLDGMLREEDEQEFTETHHAPAPTEAAPRPKQSRLRAVVDAAPATAVDDDGVIDMPASPPAEDDSSPI